MQNNKKLFGDIENKTGVKMNDIIKLADSLQSANFKDEKTVRKVISQVAQLAGKKVPKEKEDKIVDSIVNNKMPLDFNSLSKMINNKK